MNAISNKVSRFLVKQTVWMHLTMILIMSYVYMQMAQALGLRFILGWTLGQFVWGLPILAFIIYRDNINIERNTRYRLSWFSLFIIYPIVLVILKLGINSISGLDYLFRIDINGEWEFSISCMTFLGIESAISISDYRSKKGKFKPNFTNFNFFKTSALIILFFSILLILLNNYYHIHTQGMSAVKITIYTISAIAQLFVIYLSYYIYYYIHHHILFNGVLIKKGIFRYLIGLALVIMLVVPIQNFIISLFPVIDELKLHSTGLVPNIFDDFNYGIAILVLLLSFPLIATIEWYKKANALDKIEKEKSKIELSLLRQQINPHFFFNTLNNLYAMSLTNDEETPETILQLSELMRYVIYKGKEEKVLLKDEVKYLKDYIDLHMIRAFKKIDYKFDVDIKTDRVQIPPLLFIILIENAIKHGIEPAEHDCQLLIELYEENSIINFSCYNTKEETPLESTQGIGLKNMKARLDILYPNKHLFTTEESDHHFLAKLNIEL